MDKEYENISIFNKGENYRIKRFINGSETIELHNTDCLKVWILFLTNI